MKKIGILLTIILITVASCDETKKVIDVAGSVQLSGNYTLTHLGNEPVNAKGNMQLQFFAIDKSIKGNTGCNSFFGNYNLDLYALSFSEIGMTEMACEPASVMQNEITFINALSNTGSYTIENKILTLYSKNDRSILLKAKKITNTSE